MSELLLSILLGIGFAYLALQNTTAVTIQIAQWQWANIPLYGVALGALLIGLFVAWIFSLLGKASSAWTVHGKENELNHTKQAAIKMQRRIEELEEENTRLREEKGEIAKREHDLHNGENVNLFDRLRHSFSS